uniref:Uncharacterized protein n=1 Tax=Arundo donax TaxID=35708 RepID=A0A0A9CYS7_ARUDO
MPPACSKLGQILTYSSPTEYFQLPSISIKLYLERRHSTPSSILKNRDYFSASKDSTAEVTILLTKFFMLLSQKTAKGPKFHPIKKHKTSEIPDHMLLATTQSKKR